tara:strand:- start:1691 stop:2611 length:921 start_codon:yes stop_codon:yes gene_type:complete
MKKEPYKLKIKLGMSPISWTNDDLPELGGETTLETCLSETLEAGFIGTELGGKFPKNKNELKSVLAKNNLKLISGWYSGTLINNDIESEIVRITPQLNLFKDVGASVIVYGETFNTVQNKIEIPLNKRPKLNQYDINEYGIKLTKLAEHCAEQGVPLTFHHHMGTAVESEDEINKVMLSTGKDVGLLLDTGHLYFAEGSYKNILSKFGDRINHVHTKDIRLNILKTINKSKDSFLNCVLKGVFTVPGDGVIDYEDFISRLFDTGYEGWIVVEAEQDPKKANPLKYAKKGYNSLELALKKTGYEIEV